MKIKTGKTKQFPSLILSGNITGDCAVQITSKIESISRKHSGNLVVDLSAVTFIDSNGLGALVYIWKLLKNDARNIIFLCGGNFDKEIFATSNLDTLFTIVTSEEEI